MNIFLINSYSLGGGFFQNNSARIQKTVCFSFFIQ